MNFSVCIMYRGLGGVKEELQLVRCKLGVVNVQGVRCFEEGIVIGDVYNGLGSLQGVWWCEV